jgi:hypothetical protein
MRKYNNWTRKEKIMDRHSRIKATTEGNGHPREDEECVGYEEPVGRVEGCTG